MEHSVYLQSQGVRRQAKFKDKNRSDVVPEKGSASPLPFLPFRGFVRYLRFFTPLEIENALIDFSGTVYPFLI